MATIGTISGSRFIGCPITVPVTAGTAPEGATFHRVRLKMTVGLVLNGVSRESGEFEFSSPCDNGETVSFDISSSMRAMADRYEYNVTPDSSQGYSVYPEFQYQATAYDDYMVDGELKEGQMASQTVTDSNFYNGRLTDRERLTGERPSRYSRKPTTSPEICFAGAGVLWPSSLLVNGNTVADPAVNIYSYADAHHMDTEHNFYTIPFRRDGYEMRFINSLGVHESVHVLCLATEEMSVQTDNYTVSRRETLTRFSRGVTVKKNDRERWKLSSGPVDRAWQQWYLHEVLMARWAWMLVGRHETVNGILQVVGGEWLPVHILPEETVKGFDRTKSAAMEVQFTVEFDIDGSPFRY